MTAVDLLRGSTAACPGWASLFRDMLLATFPDYQPKYETLIAGHQNTVPSSSVCWPAEASAARQPSVHYTTSTSQRLIFADDALGCVEVLSQAAHTKNRT